MTQKYSSVKQDVSLKLDYDGEIKIIFNNWHIISIKFGLFFKGQLL